MANRTISMVLLILLAGVIAATTVTAQDDSYKPGYIDWEVNPVEQLFVEGMTETSAVLQRERPTRPKAVSVWTHCSTEKFYHPKPTSSNRVFTDCQNERLLLSIFRR